MATKLIGKSDFEGWELKVTASQVECRKTFWEMIQDAHGGKSSVFGQALLIVSKNGWQFNKQVGKNPIRLSMNGPCPMDLDELEGFVRVAKYARTLLGDE